MNKSVFILIIMSFFWIGCAQNSVSNVAISNNNINKLIVKNAFFNKEIEVIDYKKRFNNGLLEVLIIAKNKTPNFKSAEYRFIWLDKDGFPIEKEPWQPITFSGYETKRIDSIAHSNEANGFIFEIRPKQ